MLTNDTPTRRSSQTGAVEKRRANRTLQPFMGAIGGWTGRAAYFRGRTDSPYSTEEDRVLARLESGVLLVEVRRRYSEYRTATKGEPPHSRLDDVDASFCRLIALLETISNGHSGAN